MHVLAILSIVKLDVICTSTEIFTGLGLGKNGRFWECLCTRSPAGRLVLQVERVFTFPKIQKYE